MLHLFFSLYIFRHIQSIESCFGFCFITSFRCCLLAALRRCFQCRSRGELGSCKDPFKFNVTQIENEHGITAVPCASGWCGKVIESEGTLRDDGESTLKSQQKSNFQKEYFFAHIDYDMATQRMCVQRGPSDSEDRCAHTVYNYKKVYMCFCQGDLCNGANLAGPTFYKVFACLISIVTFTGFIIRL